MTTNGDGNGTIDQGTKITLQTVLAIIGLIAVLGTGYLSLQTTVAAHAGDGDIHHNTAQLDAVYARQETVDARLDAIVEQGRQTSAQLSRIEKKIDDHMQSR